VFELKLLFFDRGDVSLERDLLLLLPPRRGGTYGQGVEFASPPFSSLWPWLALMLAMARDRNEMIFLRCMVGTEKSDPLKEKLFACF